MPARVYPPGQIAAYPTTAAPHGYTSEVAGMPFEQYVRRTSSVRWAWSAAPVQPPPAPLAQDVPRGYRYRNGAFEERV